MTLSTLINRPCTLIARSQSGSTDELGNEIPDETTVETVCELQPKSAQEQGNQGEVSDADWVAWFLPGEDLTTADTLIVDGYEYQFVGAPPEWRNPRTQEEQFISADLRRVAGSEDAS